MPLGLHEAGHDDRDNTHDDEDTQGNERIEPAIVPGDLQPVTEEQRTEEYAGSQAREDMPEVGAGGPRRGKQHDDRGDQEDEARDPLSHVRGRLRQGRQLGAADEDEHGRGDYQQGVARFGMPEDNRHASAGDGTGFLDGRLANARRDCLHGGGVDELAIGDAQRQTGSHEEEVDADRDGQGRDANERKSGKGADGDESRGTHPGEQGAESRGGHSQ